MALLLHMMLVLKSSGQGVGRKGRHKLRKSNMIWYPWARIGTDDTLEPTCVSSEPNSSFKAVGDLKKLVPHQVLLTVYMAQELEKLKETSIRAWKSCVLAVALCQERWPRSSVVTAWAATAPYPTGLFWAKITWAFQFEDNFSCGLS
jgi:hypothetical protein